MSDLFIYLFIFTSFIFHLEHTDVWQIKGKTVGTLVPLEKRVTANAELFKVFQTDGSVG